MLLGLTFVFSGFVKTIDPWGTAFKIGEYLNVYGAAGVPDGLRIALAVVFCAAELALGFLLVFKVMPRLVSLAALVVMSVFFVVTFLSATVLPVEDCGCFGDALHLSPWASFGKNVVLWGLAFVVWLDARRRFGFFAFPKRDAAFTAVFVFLSVGLGTYCYLHLPLIDFLPYNVGADLRGAVSGNDGGGEDARMIYRDLTDGSLREFAVSDTTWYDASRWEFVEMASGELPADPDIALREFAVFNSGGDATHEIVNYSGDVYMLCAVKLDLIKPRCAEHFAKTVKQAAAQGAKVILLTSSPISDGQTAQFGDAEPVEIYNVDATTMMTMLRARVGMVKLKGGVVADKKNCRDL